MPRILLERSEYLRLQGMGGICLACISEATGSPPDARNDICPTCGEPQVFGAEELHHSGLLEVRDGE